MRYGAGDGAVRALRARVRSVAGGLQVGYELDGDLAALRIPPRSAPRKADRLWQHTCFELFVAQPGMPAYHEFNFSPSGEWAEYAFSGYRIPWPSGAVGAPTVAMKQGGQRLQLDATVALPAWIGGEPKLQIGLSAVVEDAAGQHSYWAIVHPAEKPDFHHRDSFALNLDAVRN